MSIHDIKLRWYNLEDKDVLLRKLTPIDDNCSTSDLISTMKKYHDLSNDNYRSNINKRLATEDQANKKPNEQLFKTLVVFHRNKCVAMGSILIRKFDK